MGQANLWGLDVVNWYRLLSLVRGRGVVYLEGAIDPLECRGGYHLLGVVLSDLWRFYFYWVVGD